MREVKTRNFWIFELGTQEGINIPIWVFVGFQQRHGQDSQNLSNDSFFRPPGTGAYCIIGTEKYPEASIFLNYVMIMILMDLVQLKRLLQL